ncbi:MAG: hypothetical protein KKC37_17035 [Proteobacteria bacterium]|nr:hypothetical protein [Pseudomonadota bacterium]
MRPEQVYGSEEDVGTMCLQASFFQSEGDRNPKPFQGQLAELLGRHRFRDNKKGTPAFSMVTYKPGATRGNAGIHAVTGLVYDFDHLSRSVADSVHRLLAGLAHAAYTSFSHHATGADDYCFRVILFLAALQN